MKKYILGLVVLFAVVTANAQSEVTSTDSLSEAQNQKAVIDSLQQVINTLRAEKDTYEESEDMTKKWGRSKYFNFYYGKQKLDVESNPAVSFDSDIHAGFGVGKTFYLHKKPLLGMIKFGLDWTYFQVDYSKYSYEDVYMDYGTSPDGQFGEYLATEKIDMHKAEVGMQFGPSITVNPVSLLKVNAYFRYAPTFSVFYDGDEALTSYGSYFVGGLAVSYKVISLGIESRSGFSKFDDRFFENEDPVVNKNGGYMAEATLPKVKYKNKGWRFYVSFRF